MLIYNISELVESSQRTVGKLLMFAGEIKKFAERELIARRITSWSHRLRIYYQKGKGRDETGSDSLQAQAPVHVSELEPTRKKS
jgi:hypothetical protein